jgi:hypothetical protein
MLSVTALIASSAVVFSVRFAPSIVLLRSFGFGLPFIVGMSREALPDVLLDYAVDNMLPQVLTPLLPRLLAAHSDGQFTGEDRERFTALQRDPERKAEAINKVMRMVEAPPHLLEMQTGYEGSRVQLLEILAGWVTAHVLRNLGYLSLEICDPLAQPFGLARQLFEDLFGSDRLIVVLGNS